MKRAHVAIVVLAGALAGALVAHLLRNRAAAPPSLERATLYAERRALPAFELIDQARAPFGPARMRGRWTFLFFGFVNCPDVCPTTLAMLADGARVDAGFSDIVMPGGMSGIELAAELRASYPRIGLVLASGYSALIAQGGAPEGVETLRKPYRLDELAVALGHALARASAVAELQAAE